MWGTQCNGYLFTLNGGKNGIFVILIVNAKLSGFGPFSSAYCHWWVEEVTHESIINHQYAARVDTDHK